MIDPLAYLLSPVSYEFMQRGLAASVIVGVVCAVIGCFVVLRGMAFLGDAMAHAILPGVAAAYLLQGDLLVGALVAAVLVALSIGYFSRDGQIKEDTAIGIVFAGSLALGVALMSTIRTYSSDLTHVLFGNVLGVGERDLWVIAGVGALVLVSVLALYKEFTLISFDPILAVTLKMPVKLLHNSLLVLLALTVVVSLQTVGVGLVVAMLITPAATGYLLVRRLAPMMMLAAAIGAISCIVGLYASFYANIASGAAIVLTCTVIFVLVYVFAPNRGVLWGLVRASRLARTKA